MTNKIFQSCKFASRKSKKRYICIYCDVVARLFTLTSRYYIQRKTDNENILKICCIKDEISEHNTIEEFRNCNSDFELSTFIVICKFQGWSFRVDILKKIIFPSSLSFNEFNYLYVTSLKRHLFTNKCPDISLSDFIIKLIKFLCLPTSIINCLKQIQFYRKFELFQQSLWLVIYYS